jgi:hypothetical protein
LRTYWLVAHDHNPGMFFAGRGSYLWTHDEALALHFTSEDAALGHIVYGLNGKGRAVKASSHFFAPRPTEYAAL